MRKFEVDRRISEEMELLISNRRISDKGSSRREEKTDSNSSESILIEDQWKFFFENYWKKIFVSSCVLAVLLDPSFLYIPMLNQAKKCLRLDYSLKIAAVTLRSVTDLFYIADIAFRVVYESDRTRRPSAKMTLKWWMDNSSARTTLWFIMVDILAILPIPQVMVLVSLYKVHGSGGLNAGKLAVNVFVLAQYVPRILRIYQLFVELRKTRKSERTGRWFKGALNFFMYILASHVVGAIWYYFAVQRMVGCWQFACVRDNKNKCKDSTFSCYDPPHDPAILTMLNSSCPLDPEDKKLFDFGIFLDLLQSDIPELKNYPQKLSHSFFFGLRHLSSFGSNLEPSTYTWENLFAAFISITGLLLFLYLIGNVQTYMQLETARSEERRYKIQIAQKLKKKRRDVEFWLYKNGIPMRSNKEIMPQIMDIVKQELELNKDVDVENLLSILPLQLRSHIQSLFSVGIDGQPLTLLKKVPRLQNMDENVLKAICECLKPKSYADHERIVQKNGRLEMMLFITDGLVEIESSSSTTDDNSQDKKLLKKGDFCGEELLDWVNHMAFPSVLPISTNCAARAIGNVEALVLTAEDLNSVVSMFSAHFSESEFHAPVDAIARLGLDKLPFFRSALRIE